MNVSIPVAIGLLPVLLAFAIGAHIATATALKAVLSAFEPLAEGEPPIAHYDRRVFSTADPALQPVMWAVAAAGSLGWLAIVTGLGVLWLAALAALGLSLWCDLRAWERVVVSAEAVWHQAGWGRPVQRTAIDRIREVRVEETDVDGFTLRHGRRNRVARLWLRQTDKAVLPLAATDAATGLDGVEEVANQIRARMSQSVARGALQASEAEATRAAQDAAAATRQLTPEELEARQALRRQREQALAPDLPDPARRPKATRPPGAR
jgi:hypothetical protein